jgi:hypothetical protein
MDFRDNFTSAAKAVYPPKPNPEVPRLALGRLRSFALARDDNFFKERIHCRTEALLHPAAKENPETP